jgi:hypothetical protein
LKRGVYWELARLNLGFDLVLQSLRALRQYRAFPEQELDRYSALSKEARAATNSFLSGVLEASETAEAGQRYRRRRAQEKRDEQGDD